MAVGAQKTWRIPEVFPGAEVGYTRVWFLKEEGKQGAQPEIHTDDRIIYRLQFKREDILMHNYTEDCYGCQAAPFRMSRQGHSEL